jgi:hypothetical protein
MDNYVNDNKNWHLFVFLSLLIAKEVFHEVQLGFLVVGHMHKDLKFWLFVKKLKEQNNCVGKLDENFYGFTWMTVHPPINTRNFWFQILGLWLLKDGL